MLSAKKERVLTLSFFCLADGVGRYRQPDAIFIRFGLF